MALPAAANPTADMVAMGRAYAAAKSFHADMRTADGRTMSIDAVLPDKFHETMGPMEIIFIGGQGYMKQGSSWSKLPMAMPMMRRAFAMAQPSGSYDPAKQSDYTISYMGSETVNGVAASHYRVQSKSNKQPVDMWIGANHLPARIVAQGDRGPVTIDYSQWNAVPDITAPI
jgi:hypothetical protein